MDNIRELIPIPTDKSCIFPEICNLFHGIDNGTITDKEVSAYVNKNKCYYPFPDHWIELGKKCAKENMGPEENMGAELDKMIEQEAEAEAEAAAQAKAQAQAQAKAAQAQAQAQAQKAKEQAAQAQAQAAKAAAEAQKAKAAADK